MTDYPEQSAEETAQSARGGFKPKHISQAKSVNTPIIQRLNEDEQVQYLFQNPAKGFRIFEPNGEERTPHHSWTSAGERFLVLTDQRILYIAGKEKYDKEDRIREFNYNNITEVDANWGVINSYIKFTTIEGREFKFADAGSRADDIEDAAEYVRERMRSADSEEAGPEATEADTKDGRKENNIGHSEGVDSENGTDDSSGSADWSTDRSPAETHGTTALAVYTGTPEEVGESAIDRDASTFEERANGNISGAELTSTGGKIFKVGYFESPVSARINSQETVNYVLRNFADGLEFNGEVYKPADGRRAIACITDQRLLFVVGGRADGGTAERIVSVPHNRILQASTVGDSLRVVALADQDSTVECKFVAKNTGELPDAVKYLSAQSNVSVLDQQVDAIEDATTEARTSFADDHHDKAIEAAEQALAAYDSYAGVVAELTDESNTVLSSDIPEPEVSKGDIESLLASIREGKWKREYKSYIEQASRLREEGDSTERDHKQEIARLKKAHEIATEHGVGNPEQVQERIEKIYQNRYEIHCERAEDLAAKAERQRDEEAFTDAITSYAQTLEALGQAEEIATEHNVGDIETVRGRIADIRETKHDLQVLSLGNQVSNVSTPDPMSSAIDKDKIESKISKLKSLIKRLDELDIEREEDLEFIRDEAETKLAISQLCQEKYRARNAIEWFHNGDYADARDTFEEVSDRLNTLYSESSKTGLSDYESEIDRVEKICKKNVEIARKAKLGLAEESELRPIESETTTNAAEDDIVESHIEQISDVSGTSRQTETIETPSFNFELTYDTLDKGEQIGSGGNADVYRATVTVDDAEQTIAVKEPRMQGTLHTEVVERFVAEAETWSKLDDHDHIVSVLGSGSKPIPWIALEYMDGGDLTNERPHLELGEQIDIATRVIDAVWYAHQRGIAHLDLKPENILFKSVNGRGTSVPKVTDWGLAKLLLNHSKSVEGLSPRYSAPEQFDSDTYGTPDQQTDIYQLGVILYELFAGRHPFEGPPSQVMHSVLHETPDPPSTHESNLPKELDDILLTALSKEKADRYEAAVYLRDAFQTVTLK
jgi:tRNA A-37 threonylcarbamoyl transferase component Bud32